MKSDTLWLLVGAAALYYFYTNYSTPATPFTTCKYPDGSTIQVPTGNACPFDITHGGQSMVCYSSAFIGPIPPGGVRC